MASVRFIAVAIFVALIASSAAADVADDFWDLAEFEMKDKRGVNVFEPNSATATATPNPTDVFTTRFSSLSDVFTTAVPTATPTSVIEASSTAESSVAASSAAASETASLGPSENVTPSSEATSLVFTDFTFTSVVESSAFTAFTPEPTATITLFPTSSFTPIETEVPNTSTPAPIQTSTEQSLPSSSSRFDPKSSIVSQSSVNTPVATTTSTVQATATTGAPRPRPTTVDGYTAEQLAQAVKVSLRGIKTSQFKGGPMETAFKQEVAKAANQALSRLRKRAVTIVISEGRHCDSPLHGHGDGPRPHDAHCGLQPRWLALHHLGRARRRRRHQQHFGARRAGPRRQRRRCCADRPQQPRRQQPDADTPDLRVFVFVEEHGVGRWPRHWRRRRDRGRRRRVLILQEDEDWHVQPRAHPHPHG
eukprot:Opistho-1_new@96389